MFLKSVSICSLLIVDSLIGFELFVSEFVRLYEITQVFELLERRFVLIAINVTQYLDDMVKQAVIGLVF